jgi:hypothetical protein
MNPVEPCMEPAVLISHQFNNVFDQKAICHTKSSLYHSTISIYRTRGMFNMQYVSIRIDRKPSERYLVQYTRVQYAYARVSPRWAARFIRNTSTKMASKSLTLKILMDLTLRNEGTGQEYTIQVPKSWFQQCCDGKYFLLYRKCYLSFLHL